MSQVREGKAWIVDASEWPLLITKSTGVAMEDADHAASLAAADWFLTRNDDVYVVVLDNRSVGRMSATQRKAQSDYMEKTRSRTRARCAGMAMVLSSTVTRGFMTALFWISPPEVPIKVFAEIGEAKLWAREQLERAQLRREMGKSIPPGR